MRTLFIGLVTVVAYVVRLNHAYAAEVPVIVENGEPRAEIVIAEKPERTVRLAAADLQEYVRKISGARLPIVIEPTGKGVKLFVGRSPHTDRLGITAAGLKYGAYRLVSGDDWLVFIGDDTDFVPREPYPRNNADLASGKVQAEWEEASGTPYTAPNPFMWKDRKKIPAAVGLPDGSPAPGKGETFEVWAYDEQGSYNAVCGFLNDLGVRWLLPGELGEIVPKSASIGLPKVDRTVRPDFEIRQFSMHGPLETVRWAMRLGARYPFGLLDEHGVSYMTRRPNIFAAHPDWFAVYGGSRHVGQEKNNQLCFSNEELFHEVVRFVRAEFDVYPNLTTASVMPPDGYTAICQCPKCAGKDQPERGPRGAMSNYIWHFVNRVAKEVGKTHPDRAITCSAYGCYSLPPTNIDKLEPNLVVCLVGGRRPRSGVEAQPEIRAVRESWLAKTDRPILIYENYPLTDRGYYLPTFMARTIGSSINETKGVSLGEDVHLSNFDSTSKNLGFDAFQTYFTAEMYWGGKDRDVEALLDEYCRLMYGPAADDMKRFFDHCEVRWPRMENDKAEADAALKLFAEAKAKVDPSSDCGRRLALIDAYLDGLRQKSTQLAQKRGKVPTMRLGEPSKIVIDGKLDEDYWRNCPVASTGTMRELQTGRIPTFGTTIKSAWDGRNLYFAIRCDDRPGEPLNVTATKKGDAAMWYGDAVEILLETNEHSYYQFVVNPAGALIDYDRGADRDSWDDWNSQAEVATQTADDHWTIEIRIPTTDDGNDPLHQVVGRAPTQSLPWYVNLCRQRIRENGTELSAFSPTGTNGFHERMRFAYLYKGLSHSFDVDPNASDFISRQQAAVELRNQGKRAEALSAFVDLAANVEGKGSDFRKTAALKQAAAEARALKDYDRAGALTAQIPIEAERNNAVMRNLLSRRKAEEVVQRFGDEDLTKWPFWAAGEAYYARGRAFASVGDKARAEADFKAALPLIGDPRIRSEVTESLQKLRGDP